MIYAGGFLNSFFNDFFSMFRNLLILAFRNFRKNKIYSAAIILSLALGFTVTGLLTGFIIRELNTDRFISKRDRIFRITSDDPFEPGKKMTYFQRKTLDFLDDHYPEIEKSCLMYPMKQHGISRVGDDNPITGLNILLVDSSFFDLFDFPFYMGNRDEALTGKKIVLTLSAAKKIFGKDYATAGEVAIRTDSTVEVYTISGFTGTPSENSHLKFDALVSVNVPTILSGGIGYVLMHQGTNASVLENKINSSAHMPSIVGDGKLKYYFQPLEKVYWDEQNTRTFSTARSRLFIWISSSVVIMTLFLAVFNFLNLFSLLFIRRWKEFGIKKIVGASLFSIRMIAVTEVLMYVIFSALCAFLVIYTIVPYFDSLINTGLSVSYFLHPRVILILIVIVTLISLIVIYRLSHYLYTIKPVNLLSNFSGKKARYNQWTLGIQFVISIILISCSIVMIRQVEYIHNKPLGFSRNLLEVRSPLKNDNSGLAKLKNDLVSQPGVESVSVCSGNPVSDNMILWYDLDNNKHYMPYLFIGDEDYLNTLGLHLVQGTFPSPENKNARVVNREFVKYFKMENPVGERIPGEKDQYISGVVDNFNIASLKQEIPPVIIGYSGGSNCLLIRYNPARLNAILPALKQRWQKLYGGLPFKYLFISDELDIRHEQDIAFSRIIRNATLVSILITCFGLFALSWGTSQDRSKEIGIRKVVGASSASVLVLLLKTFFKWILVAYLIALPVAWYLSVRWLEQFSFKIKLDVLTFVTAGIIILIITFLSVSYQTIRSALTNPVEELRYE